MSGIEFHCPQCDKPIKAPAGTGGKKGKCPACGRTVYIPMPPDEVESYDLTPVDEEEERRQAEIQARDLAAEKERLHDTDLPDEAVAPGPSSSSNQTNPPIENPREMVIAYLLAMADSRLDEAEQIVDQMRQQKKPVKQHIQQLTLDSMPPAELADIPPPVLKGFLKTLSDQL